MGHFKCVGLIGRLASISTQYSLQRLLAYLNKQKVGVLIDEETASVLPDTDLPVEPRNVLAKKCDLIIVVGGDGSLLAAARAFAGYKAKILGINRGRLGFLTDISPEEIEHKVGEVLAGEYLAEKRFLLSSEVVREGTPIAQGIALNDVVVHPGKFIRMIEFGLYVNDEFVYQQRSDGLIIATPTGSTAYALSCGGPIMHPDLDAIVLAPMNPHTLSSRPIVVHGDSRIKLQISEYNNLNPHVTCDGQTHVVTQPGDEVIISKSPRVLNLIHPRDHDFYDTCRTKLGWASSTGAT